MLCSAKSGVTFCRDNLLRRYGRQRDSLLEYQRFHGRRQLRRLPPVLPTPSAYSNPRFAASSAPFDHPMINHEPSGLLACWQWRARNLARERHRPTAACPNSTPVLQIQRAGNLPTYTFQLVTFAARPYAHQQLLAVRGYLAKRSRSARLLGPTRPPTSPRRRMFLRRAVPATLESTGAHSFWYRIGH